MQRLTRREKESKVQVATVDRFQGKEKDIILISCVRTLASHEINKLITKNVVATKRQNNCSSSNNYNEMAMNNSNFYCCSFIFHNENDTHTNSQNDILLVQNK